MPDCLTKRQLRHGIKHITGVASGSFGRFDKDALYGLVEWAVGPNAPTPKHRAASRDLRVQLADWAGFEYDRDRSTAPFRKDELGALVLACARQDWRRS